METIYKFIKRSKTRNVKVMRTHFIDILIISNIYFFYKVDGLILANQKSRQITSFLKIAALRRISV